MPKTTTDSSFIGTRHSLGCISDKRRTVLRITLAAFAVLLVFSLAAAPASATAWDGTNTTTWYVGNETDTSFTISTAEQLAGLAFLVNNGTCNFAGKTITLSADLDLIGDPQQWTPIGTSYSKPFKGTFDGGNHNISNLYINEPVKYYQGLFGYTLNANITNLRLKNVNVTGCDKVGGLVGKNEYGTITNCYATGNVTGSVWVGGLVGENYAESRDSLITNCYAAVTVTGTGDNAYVGGLVGCNYGTITNCYATGNVTCDGTGDYACVGGLVGKNVFGLAKITNCYATGNVTGSDNVGGLVGGNYYGTIKNSTALNQFVNSSVTNNVGRVVGMNDCGTINNCYAWKGMKVKNEIVTGGAQNNVNGDNVSSVDVWADSDFYTSLGWDISAGDTTVWKINQDDGTNYPLPYLRTLGIDNSLRAQVEYLNPELNQYFSVGDGTANNPFQISTVQDLQNLSYVVNESKTYSGGNYNEANYMLTADLNLSTVCGVGIGEWTTIGYENTTDRYNPILYPFKGKFDGQGHTISNLYIISEDYYYGLFGYTEGATIKDLRLTGVSLRGKMYVGGLVGKNNGTITNCSAIGDVEGSSEVGGLVGNNTGTITNCSATVNITCHDNNAGGLAGVNSGTITNCYATGDVTGKQNVGGLVGYNNVGKITNCYATGAVENTGSNPEFVYAGGLVGVNYGTIENSTALNPSVLATGTNVGRVVGSGGTITNCYAWNGMTDIDGNVFSNEGNNGTNASSLDLWANLTFYQNSLGWSSNISIESGSAVWKIDNTGYTVNDWAVPYLKIKPLDITPILHLKPAVYNVTFNNNTGSGTMDNQSFVGGETKNLSKNNFTKTGYNFTGWNTDNGDQIDVVDEQTISITEDTTLYAVWKANVTNITLDPNGGIIGTSEINITYNNQSYTPDDIVPPTKPMYYFNGWYNESDGGVEIINNLGHIIANREGYTGPNSTWINDTREITLYANWIQMYNVTFNSTTGAGTMANQSFASGVDQALNTNTFTKSGYTFDGWNKTSADGKNIDYTDGQIINISSDITLYAVWRESSTPTPAPTRPSGGSTDTGSGSFNEYPRTVTDGGEVTFGTSPTVSSVNLPEGVSGSVMLVVKSDTPVPGDMPTYKVFEINIPNYPEGEEAVIQFKITLAELEKAGYNAEDICLYHCDENGVWTALPTTFTIIDSVVYYESITTAFSPFAIVFEENGATEVSQPVVTPVKTQTAEPVSTYVEPTKTAVPTPEQTKSPVGLFGLGLGLLGAALVLRRK